MKFPTENSPWCLIWTADLSVGIPQIDEEHQHFIQLVNELNRAIVQRADFAEIKQMMQSILDDAVVHFEHEEAFFKQWGYPDAEDHAEKHAQAVRNFTQIMANLTRGGVEFEWIKAGLAIKQSLIDHLLNEDFKYRDFYQARELNPRVPSLI